MWLNFFISYFCGIWSFCLCRVCRNMAKFPPIWRRLSKFNPWPLVIRFSNIFWLQTAVVYLSHCARTSSVLHDTICVAMATDSVKLSQPSHCHLCCQPITCVRSNALSLMLRPVRGWDSILGWVACLAFVTVISQKRTKAFVHGCVPRTVII